MNAFHMVYFILACVIQNVVTEINIESDSVKPRWDKVNRGVWINNKRDGPVSKTSTNFIFRSNSLEADNQVQNSYYSFEKDNHEETPLFGDDRKKRSPEIDSKRSLIKNAHNLKEPITPKYFQDKSPFKLLTKIRPASVFNDYPYQVAVIIDDMKKDDIQDSGAIIDDVDVEPVNIVISNVNYNTTDKNYYENKIIKKIELTENLNKTDEFDDDSKISRNVFDIRNYDWPYAEKYASYKTISKGGNKIDTVNEKSILKLLSVITKSFKKIVKQHENIRQIHDKLVDIKGDFVTKSATVLEKFHDFDMKYMYIIKLFEKLKLLEKNMSTQEEYYRRKEKELAQNFLDFEEKQKKFLEQQEQFYNIQKIMITQNEKINMKQHAIAKTQSDIAHKQNNFARFMKKSKQLYAEKSQIKVSKENKTNNYSKLHAPTKTDEPQSLKLNMLKFSRIYPVNKNDKLILQDKDSQPVDDLVYKHYFNNTFIEHLMKSKVLINPQEDKKQVIKRSEFDLNTTVLLPVQKTAVSFDDLLPTPLHRERRWINRHSKLKSRKNYKGKKQEDYSLNDGINLRNGIPVRKTERVGENDPFTVMATEFCKKIKQDRTEQILKWCIEKSLRRLKIMDFTDPSIKKSKTTLKYDLNYKANINVMTTVKINDTSVNSSTTEPTTPTSSRATVTTEVTNTPISLPVPPSNYAIYFPDNDELESNIKQYEIKPDTEGNVYYDGSLHASDMIHSDDDDFSDVIPNLDSNSRIDVDPTAFDVALRRQYLKKFGYKKKA